MSNSTLRDCIEWVEKSVELLHRANPKESTKGDAVLMYLRAIQELRDRKDFLTDHVLLGDIPAVLLEDKP